MQSAISAANIFTQNNLNIFTIHPMIVNFMGLTSSMLVTLVNNLHLFIKDKMLLGTNSYY